MQNKNDHLFPLRLARIFLPSADISQMTSFLTIPDGQNAINPGKHCQAGFAYC
jgi:hypothetical protein